MKRSIAVLAILGLFATFVSFAQMKDPHPMDMTQAIQNAKTSTDHEALAKHYEEAAQEMQSKAQEHKKRLERYKTKSHLYGKQAEPLQEHCNNLIHIYEQAVEANRSMADSHRKMATESK